MAYSLFFLLIVSLKMSAKPKSAYILTRRILILLLNIFCISL